MRAQQKFWRRGGEFNSYQEWVNKAASWLGPRSGIRRGTAIMCIDAKGRPCNVGYDFMRARDEGAFPVAYFVRDMDTSDLYAEIGQRKAEKAASEDAA